MTLPASGLPGDNEIASHLVWGKCNNVSFFGRLRKTSKSIY